MLFTISARPSLCDRHYTFASALLVTMAFWFSESSGFLILFSWLPLVMISRSTFRLGFYWGMITFACHFVWLLAVLKNKTAAPEWGAALLYLGVVGYFALTSGAWFWFYGLLMRWWMSPSRRARLCTRSSGRPDFFGAVLGEGEAVRPSVSNHMNGWRRLVSWWVCTFGYYWFLSGYSLWIFGRLEGYPFLNPAIPLARYPWFLWIVGQGGLITQCLFGLHSMTARPAVRPAPPPIEFIYCPPVSVPTLAQTPVGFGQAVYHQLTNLNLPPYDGNAVRVVVAPETFYQASLNLHEEQVKLWTAALPDDVHMIIGSQATLPKCTVLNNGRVLQKYYQTAYWLHQGLIKKYYVKKHRVPFAEKTPKFWQKIEGIKTLFLTDNLQFSRDHRPLKDGLWELAPRVVVLPQLCSELFFSTHAHEIWRAAHGCGDGANFFIIFLVNDSWFVKYFKQILQDLTALKAAYLRVPVVYVGHEAMKVYGN